MKIRTVIEYHREDNVVAFQSGEGWVLRGTFGPAFFWEPNLEKWEPITKSEVFNPTKYMLTFSMAMHLLETLPPFKP